jgi:REP element-mobilizing transposase RayT
MLHLDDPGLPLPPLPTGIPSFRGPVALVGFPTAGLHPRFVDPAHATQAAKALQATRQDGPTHLLAWVLLPDHWHGLLGLAPNESLPRCVARLKSAMARHLRDADPQRERVWSTRYTAAPVRTEVDLAAAMRTIVHAPVRAGLVAHPSDYAFWDAVWLRGAQAGAPASVATMQAETL